MFSGIYLWKFTNQKKPNKKQKKGGDNTDKYIEMLNDYDRKVLYFECIHELNRTIDKQLQLLKFLYDDELIANKEEDLAKWLGVASIEFLDINKLAELFSKYNMLNCQHCFGVSNKYNKKTLEW